MALRDSATTLDSVFKSLRDLANGEAIAMRALDRRGAAYASRFDAWQRVAAAAESARALRDRTRARASAFRERSGDGDG